MGKKSRKYREISYSLMANPLEHIRQHPQLAKQLIGVNLPQLEQLIQQAICRRQHCVVRRSLRRRRSQPMSREKKKRKSTKLD